MPKFHAGVKGKFYHIQWIDLSPGAKASIAHRTTVEVLHRRGAGTWGEAEYEPCYAAVYAQFEAGCEHLAEVDILEYAEQEGILAKE